MGKKSGPKAPDPAKTAEAQAEANKEAIYASADINRYNQITPYGTVTWTPPTGSYGGAYTAGGATPPSQFAINWMSRKNGGGVPPPQPLNNTGRWTQTVKLGDAEQLQKDLQDQTNANLGRHAVRMSGQLPKDAFSYDSLGDMSDPRAFAARNGEFSYGDLGHMLDPSEFSDDAAAVEKATYQRLQNLMSPQFEERRNALDNRLAVMGIPVGGEAYGLEKDRYDRMRNEADINAALESVFAGRQEQSRMNQMALANRAQRANEMLSERGQRHSEFASRYGMESANRAQRANEMLTARNQKFNELAAVLQGSPALQTPSAPATAQYQIAPPDISGLIQNQYNTKAANQASKKGGVTDLAGTLGAAGIGAAFSDARLKDDIQEIGKVDGHMIYKWRWNDAAADLGLTGEGSGVLAQDVEKYAPEAVVERNGYKAVNYGALFEGVA